MLLDSQRDLRRASVRSLDVAQVAGALEPEFGCELTDGQSAALAIIGNAHGLGSHITNEKAIAYVRTCRADLPRRLPYKMGMARRGIPKTPPMWYLKEWMAARGMKGRGAQAKMMQLTDWSKATMSQLYNGSQDFSPKILREAADALGCQPYELLMPPEQAMAILRLRKDALRIVEDARPLETDLSDIERTGTEG